MNVYALTSYRKNSKGEDFEIMAIYRNIEDARAAMHQEAKHFRSQIPSARNPYVFQAPDMYYETDDMIFIGSYIDCDGQYSDSHEFCVETHPLL